MGIRHLHTFMFQNCPGGVQEINIKREIDYHRRTCNVERPVIIIDLVAIHEHIYTNDKEKLFGGRYDLYNFRIDEIFRKLIDLGVEIICVQDGSLFENKIDTVIKRRNDRYIKEWQILNQIEKEINLNDRNLKLYPPNLTPFFHNLRVIARRYSTVIIATREGDQEIVYQANNKNALAIISHDTDFLIFEGNWQFWSGPHLNIDKNSIIRYNKTAVRANLSLSPKQMIVFATISGNDFVQYDMVEDFHKRIGGRNKFSKIANVVRRVRSLPPNIKSNDEGFLMNLIFKPQDRKIGLKDFRKSINFYSDVNEPVTYNNLLLEKASHSTFLYSVLTDTPVNLSLFYFNLTKCDLIPYYQLIKPIIQRQIGTLLKNCKENLNSLTRPILTKLHHNDSYKIVDEIPIYPKDDVPELEDLLLMSIEKHDKLYQLKLTLFCWHIFPDCEKLTPETLSNLPDELVLTISIITYLIANNQISIDEADCILFACIHKIESKNHVEIGHFTKLNERDARVSFLFTRLYSIFLNSIQILGLNNLESLITFDGLYYHYLRCNLEKENNLIQTLRKEFKNFRIYSNE